MFQASFFIGCCFQRRTTLRAIYFILYIHFLFSNIPAVMTVVYGCGYFHQVKQIVHFGCYWIPYRMRSRSRQRTEPVHIA